MQRRNFLKDAGLSAVVPFVMNGMSLKIARSSALGSFFNLDNDRVLVLIQLQGGNDGLNTLIPLEYIDLLANHRPKVFIPQANLIPLDATTALHPALEPFKALYDEGKLGIVHSVGYPNQNRSHFRSTDIWSSGSAADAFDHTGWLGKYLDTKYQDYPAAYPNENTPDPIAITMGGITSETCQGVASNFSLAIEDPYALSPLDTSKEASSVSGYYGDELTFIQEEIAKTNAYTGVISKAVDKGRSLATYPDNNSLARQLRNVATLISGGLQTKIYICSIGGFDTHADQVDQGDTRQGTHTDLLAQTSEAIKAFQEDIELLGEADRVLGMTFSEFGRQIASNQSLGTDHGTAAPLFLFGNCVGAGAYGQNPDIPEKLAPQEGVAMQTDFRDVYGTVLQQWFEVDPSAIKEFLFPEFTSLPIIAGCQSTSVDQLGLPGSLQIFPNPFESMVMLKFDSPGGKADLTIFNALGAEIRRLQNHHVFRGQVHWDIQLQDLPPGNYHFRLKLGNVYQTKTAVKIK